MNRSMGYRLLLCGLAMLSVGCVDDDVTSAGPPTLDVTSEQLADIFGEPLGWQDLEIDWPLDGPAPYQDDATLIDAVRQANGRVFVGFKEANLDRIAERPTVSKNGLPKKVRRAVSAETIKDGRQFLLAQGAKILMPFRRLPSVVAEINPEVAPQILAHPLVDFIEPDEPLQVAARSSAGTSAAKSRPMFQDVIPSNMDSIRVPSAHAQGYTGSGVTITVIDTGVWDGFLVAHEDHPLELNCVAAASVPLQCLDYFPFHGTKMAGIALARANGIGVVGVAPAANLNKVKVCNQSLGCPTSFTVSGLEWSATNGQREIINLSLGGQHSTSLSTAVQSAFQAGDVLVAAIGDDQSLPVLYPAAYVNVVAVAGVRPDGQRRDCSTSGLQVDVSGPGWTEQTTTGNNDYDGQGADCTSGATAHVSGIAALIWQKWSSWTNISVRSKLLSSVVDTTLSGNVIGTQMGWDSHTGYGRIDALKAIGAAPTLTASISGPSTVSQPSTWFANWSGGVAPFTWTWTGVLSGGGTSVSGLPQQSGFLYLTVTSHDGQQKTASKYITVEGGGCGPMGC